MTWNLVAYLWPAANFYNSYQCASPAFYDTIFDQETISEKSKKVSDVVINVLKNERSRLGSWYYEEIQQILEKTKSKKIDEFVQQHLKVINTYDNFNAVHAAGVIGESEGNWYISISPYSMFRPKDEELPFVIAHELSHLLNSDRLKLPTILGIATLSTVIVTHLVLGWSLLPSLGLVSTTNAVVRIGYQHKVERRADDFAIQHCTNDQLLKGISFFKRLQNIRLNQSWVERTLAHLSHPSDSSRITKIEQELQKKK